LSSLESKVESLIFCSPKPIKISDIIKAFSESESLKYNEEKIFEAIIKLKKNIVIRPFHLK
tara:strand:- start:8243 stop:8425 length:183 start_codon:yes stop_codon:yes gene_type:complete